MIWNKESRSIVINLVKLTETIVKKIVKDEESVSVKEFDSDEENTVQIEVMVPSEELGRVIGKEGRTINAIRTIVQASSYISDNKKVIINVDAY